MKPQYQIESRTGVCNLSGMCRNCFTMDALLEDIYSFCKVHQLCPRSVTLTVGLPLLLLLLPFTYWKMNLLLVVFDCVWCVCICECECPCTHEEVRGGCLPLGQNLSVNPEPDRLACKHQRASCLWPHAGVTAASFLRGCGIWTQDHVLPTESSPQPLVWIF